MEYFVVLPFAHILLTKSPLSYFKHLNFLNVRDKFLRSKIQYHSKCVSIWWKFQIVFLYNVQPYVHKWPLFLQLNPKLSQTNVTLMIWCGVNFHSTIFSLYHISLVEFRKQKFQYILWFKTNLFLHQKLCKLYKVLSNNWTNMK